MLNFSNKNVKIVEKLKYLILISLVVVFAGIAMSFIKGMNVGIDFSGGAKIDIDLSSFASEKEVRDIIETEVNSFLEENGCKPVGALQISPSNSGGVNYEFRLAYYHNGELKTKEAEQEFISFVTGDLSDNTNNGLCGELEKRLDELFKSNSTLVQRGATIDENSVKAYTVGATASGALLRSAIIALLVAVIAILVYIVIRFTLISAFAAVLTVMHDILITIVVTIIFQVPVNSIFIAAVITIAGYSINATIVIFDRIRENLKLEENKLKSDEEIANMSIMSTLGRTLLTSCTTLVMVVLLAAFSVPAIQEFILPIMFGLVAGTFSSVCLAPSFWVLLRRVERKIKQEKTSKKGYKKTPTVK